MCRVDTRETERLTAACVAEETEHLFINGHLPACLVAIVGTRKPSPEASDAAFSVARTLAESGIGVVSGLALGIDGAAHRGCLAGGGNTVAVLGHGLDMAIYPPQHTALAEVITQRGALVSPFPFGTALQRRLLLARNRWIARLARVVWVVQTGVPGGALSAAACARQHGIPVVTTPWDEPHWQAGYQSLIQHGAHSIDLSSAASLLAQLGHCTPNAPQAQGRLALG